MVTSIKGNDTSTFGGNVDVTGNVITDAPAFHAYQYGGQTLSSSTVTKLQIGTELFDTNSNYDNATNYRFTPTVAGYYQINAAFSIGTTATTGVIYLYKNGSQLHIMNNCGNSATWSGGMLVYCNGTTDYIEIYGLVTTGQGITEVYFDGHLARAV